VDQLIGVLEPVRTTAIAVCAPDSAPTTEMRAFLARGLFFLVQGERFFTQASLGKAT
jgi:hypothetical protein